MKRSSYTPGVCNIGPAEIARRRGVGWFGLVLTIMLLAALLGMEVEPWYRLIIFFPAFLSATGFLQAYFHFCVGFARRGLYNFGQTGNVKTVESAASQRRDRLYANKITLYAAAVALVVAGASLLL